MTENGLAVLDASILLAILLVEQRALNLPPAVFDNAVVSTVSLTETQSKLVRSGYDPEAAWQDTLSIVSDRRPHTEDQARIAGTLIRETKPIGLSLGDRCCLALGITLRAPVYTTDSAWEKLNLGIPIHIIR